MITAFQRSAFQNNAFQISYSDNALYFDGYGPVVGIGIVATNGAVSVSGYRPAIGGSYWISPYTARLTIRSRISTVDQTGVEIANRQTIYIIDPVGMDLREWADAMTLHLEPVSHSGRLESGDWRSWAAWLCAAPNLSFNHPPSPYEFDDWREWAKSFNNSMSSAGI